MVSGSRSTPALRVSMVSPQKQLACQRSSCDNSRPRSGIATETDVTECDDGLLKGYRRTSRVSGGSPQTAGLVASLGESGARQRSRPAAAAPVARCAAAYDPAAAVSSVAPRAPAQQRRKPRFSRRAASTPSRTIGRLRTGSCRPELSDRRHLELEVAARARRPAVPSPSRATPISSSRETPATRPDAGRPSPAPGRRVRARVFET